MTLRTIQSHMQLNPAIADPPVMKIRLKQKLALSPSKFIFISYIGNNKFPPITDKNG